MSHYCVIDDFEGRQETGAGNPIGWYSTYTPMSTLGYLQTRNWNHLWIVGFYRKLHYQRNKSVIDYNKSTSFGQIKDVKIPVWLTVFHFWLRMVLNAMFVGISIKAETPSYHEMKFRLFLGSLICNEQIRSKPGLVWRITKYPKFYLKDDKHFIPSEQPSESWKLRFDGRVFNKFIYYFFRVMSAVSRYCIANLIAKSTHQGDEKQP